MEQNTINLTDLTVVDGAEELSNLLGMDVEKAMGIVELLDQREETAGHRSTLMKISDWMAEQWQKEHGESSEYIIVDTVEDYSERAWRVEGGLLVDDSVADLLNGGKMTDFITRIDHGTDEYPRDVGMTWVAKSQCEFIVHVE